MMTTEYRLRFMLIAVGALVLTLIATLADPAAGQERPLDDRAIQDAVSRLLDDDPLLDAVAIGAKVDDGVVTLQGLARSLRDKDRAERLAVRVRGVRAVVNSIRLAPSDRPDAELADDVRAALASEPVTRDSELLVRAGGGKITLAGRVDSLAERTSAYVIANGVRGVLGVDVDDVRVVRDDSRPAAELEREIAARLAWNVWTADAELMVEVANGVAILRGSVANLWMRQLAAELAAIPGIERVDVSGVGFVPGAADPMKRTRPRAYPDQQTAQAIERALMFDIEVVSSDIDIRVSDGAALLTGTVPTLAQREQAAAIARDTVGVRAVQNDIAIRAHDPPSDERLVQLIKDRLARAPAFTDNPPIAVLVQGGVVTLLGTVENLYDKRRAEDLAKRQVGVVGVLNKLRLSQARAGEPKDRRGARPIYRAAAAAPSAVG